MISAVLRLGGPEPSPLWFRHPFGVDLDLTLFLRDQADAPVDPTTVLPQLALLPRSKGGVYGYDMEVADAVNGRCTLNVPGPSFADPSGYGLEVYQRRPNPTPGDPALPVGLIGKGALVMDGTAYQRGSPLGMISVPVVTGPPGPPGPQGPSGGKRGSIWFTGNGPPVGLEGMLAGDLYLDENTGDVWTFDETTGWARRMS